MTSTRYRDREAPKRPVIVQRATCEGCVHLARERPRCLNEDSEHFRTHRESYHDRCGQFAWRRKPDPEPAQTPHERELAAWNALGRGVR